MLAASIDGFFAFLAACYELTSVLFLCFSCLIPLLFVTNIFFFLSSFSLLRYINRLLITTTNRSHYYYTTTRAVVRQCFNGDDATHWKRPKFDPSPRQNPLAISIKIDMLDYVMDGT